VRGADVLYCLLHDRVDRDVINANPKLLGIASTTITPADIDIAAATARGLPVTVIPAALLDDATADLAWALMLNVARRVAEADRLMRGGTFPGSQSAYMEGGGVSGKTLGLIGMGGVGRAAARRAAGFSMRVLYHDPRRLIERVFREYGARAARRRTGARPRTVAKAHRGRRARRVRARAAARSGAARHAERRADAARGQRRDRAAGAHGGRRRR
jgi:glyoxylate reductase